jgi:drug/metabolite transporter (DMT)-like permease
VAILACFFLKETIGWRTSIGIAISFMGTGAIAFAKSGTISFEIGVLFALIAALSQALFTLWQKPLLGRYSALEVTTYSMLAGALFSLPFGWTVFETVQTVPNDVVFALVYLSVFASAVGYIMWAYVLSYYPASKTASFLYVIPVSATVIAWIWIGQEPSAITLVGGAITLLGVAIVNVRRQQKKEAKGEAK